MKPSWYLLLAVVDADTLRCLFLSELRYIKQFVFDFCLGIKKHTA